VISALNDLASQKEPISKFLVNEYPFRLDEFGKFSLSEQVRKAYLFNTEECTLIFSLEEQRNLSIYTVKSYMNTKVSKKQEKKGLKAKISNFRMAKKVTLELPFTPKHIEFYGEHFTVTYQVSNGADFDDRAENMIDIFEKSGKPVNRFDIQESLIKLGIGLLKIIKVKFPRLSWSDRKVSEFEITRQSALQKVVVAGHCLHQRKERPFLAKVNLQECKIELIKILSVEDKISEVNFGPYDNGHLLVGFKSGVLHIFDPVELTRMQSINLFTSSIKQIRFEPTSLIFVGS